MRALSSSLTAMVVLSVERALPVRGQRAQTVLQDASGFSSIGIGFDLTTPHATAAVSFPNGTTVTLLKVPGDDEYVDMIQRLDLPSSQHPVPPYKSVFEGWCDAPRESLRWARKRLDLPASPDVGTLAKMLLDLRAGVENHLGGRITSAAVTTAPLLALYEEDLIDAFEYVGLEYIKPSHPSFRNDFLHETSSAFAGNGLGLCQEYEDVEDCEDEERNMKLNFAMTVVFTDTVLISSISGLESAYSLYEPRGRYRVNFDLGYANRYHGGRNQTAYMTDLFWELWSTISDNMPGPTSVLVMGDRVEELEFMDVLGSVLFSLPTLESPPVYFSGAVGVAGRGAAEIAKREMFKRRYDVEHI